MKKLIFSVMTVAFVLIGCGQKENTTPVTNDTSGATAKYQSCVTAEEYQQASPIEKKLINQIDATIAALEVMKREDDSDEIVSLITVSLRDDNLLSNMTLIGKDKASTTEISEMDNSCKVCKEESAYECIKQIAAAENELGVYVKNKDACVEVYW